MKAKCVICGAEFEAKLPSAKYCSKVCANHSRFDRTLENVREERKEAEKALRLFYAEGMRDKEIAARIGRSITWVQKTRVSMNLPRQGKKEIVCVQSELRSCNSCGALFVPRVRTQLYCSETCERRESRRRNGHKKRDYDRKRTLKAQRIDYIPLQRLYERDKGICYLCGGKCDFNAVKEINGIPYALGDYPSRDHVKPLSKGGLHSWDNVRLAHIRCNSSKGAKYG